MSKLTDHIVFNDKKLAARYENGGKIPLDTLFEAYFDGAIDLKGDIYALLDDRYVLGKHQFTPEHVKYFVTKFVPEFAVHSKKLDTELVRWHYDRGNDFFAAFLGERMIYTSAWFTHPGQTLEEGQDQKMDMVCQKLMLKPTDTLLDIGCGWGTLATHAAKYYGVTSTGVTLSKNQTEFGNSRIAAAGLSNRAHIECKDYRDIAKGRYNKISNLEMVEHVGVKNLVPFYKQVYDLLDDQGLFLMQWTGLRRGSKVEDLVWGLFMAKYIFAGADASLPLAPMMNAMEKAGFEIHSVENVTTHYRYTLKKWHDNWLSNAETVKKTYGERWFRIWHVFLAWAVTVSQQGTAACFQVLAHKNLNEFDRTIWMGKQSLGERMTLPNRSAQIQANVAELSGVARGRLGALSPREAPKGGAHTPRLSRFWCCWWSDPEGDQTRSMIVAMPMPPPMQSVMSAVPRSIAPVAPRGCPRAMAPPLTLTRSGSIPRFLIVCSGTTAKASLISHRSMSEACIPAILSAFCEAGVGAVSMMTGSAPAVAIARIRPRGRRPWALA